MGVWLVVWNWECHHPNWRTSSFLRGVGQPPTRLCGVMYGTWHIPTCSRLLLTIPLLDVFFAYVDDLWDPWCFTLQLTPRFAFLQRCPPGILQVSSRNGYFLQNRHMNSDDFHHGNSWDWVRCSAQKIVPCEAQIRPRAFPAARIRKRRPSATASKNARRPRRCRTCWRTTNELLCIYILLYLYMYNIYIFYKICI